MSNKVSVPLTKDALLKSYRKRLKDDVTSMMSNFTEIIKLCKIEEHAQITRPAQCEEDAFEMQVRAANMVSLSRQHTLLDTYHVTSLFLVSFSQRFRFWHYLFSKISFTIGSLLLDGVAK